LPGTKVVSSYNNLSLIYKGDLGDRRQRGFGLGRLEKALEFQLKALNIREQVLDKNHPDLAQSYNNIAMIYKAVKDYEPAETYGEKAVAILQRLFPNGHPNLETAKRNLEGIWKRCPSDDIFFVFSAEGGLRTPEGHNFR